MRLVAEALGGTAEWDPYLDGAAVTSAGSGYDAVDLYWLSHIIYAESGAESMEGQIAVGNVVLNRVASDSFPNTVPAVIFDRKNGVQFEPVSNGTIYKTPSSASVQAAKRAMDGERPVLLRAGALPGALDHRQPDVFTDHRLPPLLPLIDF